MPENPILSMPNGERYEWLRDGRPKLGEWFFYAGEACEATFDHSAIRPILRRLPQDESPLGDGDVEALVAELRIELEANRDEYRNQVKHLGASDPSPQIIDERIKRIEEALKPFDPPKPEPRFTYEDGAIYDNGEFAFLTTCPPGAREDQAKAAVALLNSLVAKQEQERPSV